MQTLKLYNALALLTDCAKILLRDIDKPATLSDNLKFLSLAIQSAEKILHQNPIPATPQ